MMYRVLLLLTVLFASTVNADAGRYELGAGDQISISVYDEPDLSIEKVRIGPSGSISYPLLGEIQVAGLSPEEFENSLIKGLKGPYLVNPSVTVSVVEYRPFYVTGEVSKPGSYPFHPGLTIDKAISVAGGFTERASKSKIYVIHDGAPDVRDAEENKISVKLSDIVKPGDVVTVEQSFF
ncbi:MAG: capsular biosynthesis protein [Oceanospirillaceae bacterium]|uniref:polysaccharide biosynthesis/export family protein n=1 Tax=unclassified Thalassolituus TaxID=2624967 RepID=UPI000C090421|nr:MULTISPECIES: polysaccharide biosynthesis/export family protein [unclassified Thalassolituus]MAK90455.1 capsular biosynthesis protein [Thalassolituus sp.]MBS51909.1 capsular biosynthesis protein [Oceanospirillaceae bacterium]